MRISIKIIWLTSLLLSAAAAGYYTPKPVNPVLLVPGVGGTVLQLAKTTKDVWINLDHFLRSLPDVAWESYKLPGKPFYDTADNDFRQFALGKYRALGEIGPVFSEQDITVPYALKAGHEPTCEHNRKAGGLCGIEYVVDFPDSTENTTFSRALDLFTEHASFNNYAAFIHYLEKNIGLIPGKNLFGFAYDWRQSVRAPATLLRLDDTLRTISNDGAVPASVFTHSMGCMVMKSYINAFPENAARFIKTWIAVAGPFQGVGGEILGSFFSGYMLGNPTVCNCSARQLAVQSPALMDLMPSSQSVLPPLTLQIRTPSQRTLVQGTAEILELIESAYRNHSFSHGTQSVPWPLSHHAREWATETQEKLQAATIPSSMRIYAVSGLGMDTPYGGTLRMEDGYKPGDLICEKEGCPENQCTLSARSCEIEFDYTTGDGTVVGTSSANPYGLGEFPNLMRRQVFKVSHQDLIKPNSGMYDTYAQWLGFSPTTA